MTERAAETQEPGAHLFSGGSWRLRVVMAVVASVSPLALSAQINMPDPSQIHGKAIPAPELPNGTVTVRVVRESLANNVAGQEVRVTSGSTMRTAKTNADGRAEFAGLPTGSEARAEATINGEQLASEPFSVPSSGGLRVILVAGLAGVAERRKQEEERALTAPPVKGVVVFGSGSRVLLEFQNDALQVYYILDVLNNARARVDPGGPLILDLPSGAGGASALEGSSPQATVAGNRITITGPFAPGMTTVQVGYALRYSGSAHIFEQKWPAAIEQVTVGLEKVGAVSMTSPQFATTGDVRSENGTTFILANGRGLPANGTLSVQLTGLPSHSSVPRYTALTLACGLLVWGGWLAFSGRADARDDRRHLLARRDTLLGDLAQLEERRRAGQESVRQAARRQRIISDLEQIYGELDRAGDTPRGGGEGVAA